MRSSTSCLLLTATFALLATPRIADASCIPGFDYAVFADDAIHIQGGSTVDSFNSSAGTYSQTATCGTNGDLGTNSTAADEVELLSASINVCGDVYVGAGGTAGTVIDQHANANVTGTKGAQSTNTTLTPPDLPTPALPNASPFSPSWTNTHATLAPGFTYGDVSCKNGSLTLSSGKYVVSTLSLTSNCELRVSGGQIEFYFTSSLDLHGGEIVNTTGVPGNLIFFGTSAASTAGVQGGVDAYFALYAPTATCTVQGNADIYGAIVCRSADLQGNGNVHYDIALGALGGGGFACTGEVSRAAPVIALLNGGTEHLVQGSFEPPTAAITTITSAATIATWTFPYQLGHMRARVASTVTTTASSFSAGTVYFDAGATGMIPDADYTGCTSFNGSCRHVFTNTNSDAANGTTFHPTTAVLSDTTADAIGALIVPTVTGLTTTNYQAIIHKVLDAKLGGVDRSTVAVIEASQFAGASTRPAMAYFGGTDGMLHAVCAQAGGRTASSPSADICPAAGTELWAFIPRVQLPLIGLNTARIDGSVRVADVFGDFTNNPATGTKSWHTILTFQTGFAIGSKPAVYAFDITDPANPTLLWEYTVPTSPAAAEVGTGLITAMASPYIKGVLTNMAVVQTNNGGSGTAGVVATALSQETGTKIWQFSDIYPVAPRGVAADGPMPTTAIPGGAVGVDSDGQNYISDFVMGDIMGRLWQLNAVDGTSRNGTSTPLFSFTTNRHPFGSPPAIYSRNGTLYAATASGGYTDPVSTSWTSTTQYLIGVKLSYRSSTTLTEATTASATGPVGINTALTSGDRTFSQALVVGTQLFLTSDSSDINLATYGTSTAQTGRLTTFDITTGGTPTTAVITSGATSLAYSSGTNQLYSSSRNSQEQLSAAPTNQSGGEKVDLESAPQMSRNLWLRSE